MSFRLTVLKTNDKQIKGNKLTILALKTNKEHFCAEILFDVLKAAIIVKRFPRGKYPAQITGEAEGVIIYEALFYPVLLLS